MKRLFNFTLLTILACALVTALFLIQLNNWAKKDTEDEKRRLSHPTYQHERELEKKSQKP